MADTCDLTSYAELAEVLDNLPILVREKRRRARLSLRATGEALGCAASTVMRFETGQYGIDTATLARIVRWLGEPGPSDPQEGR